MKLSKRLLYLAGVVIVTASSSYGIRLWANQSSQGTATVGSSSSNTTSTATPLRISTSYFSTTLPSEFNIKRQSVPSSEETKLVVLANTSASSDEQVAITVADTPSEGIQASADYNLRATEKTTYTQTTLESSATLTAFRRITDPAELTIFWPHGTQYAEISCSTSGGATFDELRTLCTNAVNAWEWQ